MTKYLKGTSRKLSGLSCQLHLADIWENIECLFMCILPIYMSGCENFPFQRATELELGFIVKLGWLVANGYNWTELGMERYSANKVK